MFWEFVETQWYPCPVCYQPCQKLKISNAYRYRHKKGPVASLFKRPVPQDSWQGWEKDPRGRWVMIKTSEVDWDFVKRGYHYRDAWTNEDSSVRCPGCGLEAVHRDVTTALYELWSVVLKKEGKGGLIPGFMIHLR